MTTNTPKKAAGASNTNGLHADTNSGNYPLDGAVDQANIKANAKRSSSSLTTVSTALIQAKGQSLFISSTVIASLFCRPHKNVMRDIEKLVGKGTISRLSLELRDYVDSRGKVQRSYILTERDALVLMPFLGGRYATEGQAKLVDEFLRMQNELLRIANKKADPATQLSIREKCAAANLLADALVDMRTAQGKETKPCHFSNEHKLCNWALTGQQGRIEDDSLDRFELRRLKAIRIMDARLLYQSMPYPERKAALRKAFPLRQQGGDLVKH